MQPRTGGTRSQFAVKGGDGAGECGVGRGRITIRKIAMKQGDVTDVRRCRDFFHRGMCVFRGSRRICNNFFYSGLSSQCVVPNVRRR